MPRSTALHMSYNVRAAIEAAVSASISTPVWPVNVQVAVMWTLCSAGNGCNSTFTLLNISGWQVSTFLRRLDTGDARHSKHITLLVGAISDHPQRSRLHVDPGFGGGRTLCQGLTANVYHVGAALVIEMGQGTHGNLKFLGWGTLSPCAVRL